MNGNGRGALADPVNELLFGLRSRGLKYRASEMSPDGPWRAQCPQCVSISQPEDLPLTISRTGAVRCKHQCDPSRIAEELTPDSDERDGSLRELDPRIVLLEDFVDVDEAGASPVVGDAHHILVPEGGDVMVYGDGGAGKTTLSVDLAFHLAAGDSWLQIPIPVPRRVLLIEGEGPRPLFRQKLGQKLDGWKGGGIAGRIRVFEEPWARFTFADEQWRAKLAASVSELEIDVLFAGPVVRLGMDSAGTLQEVRAFMELVADVRRQSGRALTVILIHHENKGGTVSGAWEGAGDTLLHVQGAGNGHTVVLVQKVRWDSERHGKTLQLAWTDGAGFRLEDDRSYLAEIEELLGDGQWRTAKQIAAPHKNGGIGAGESTVKATLDQNPERFESRTGEEAKAVGRSSTATVWQVRSAPNAPDAPSALFGGGKDAAAAAPPLKGAAAAAGTPGRGEGGALDASTHLAHLDADAELERPAARVSDLSDEAL